MTYQEYKQQKQDEFNSLPIFFAFSDEQFEKEMNKRGLTSKDTDKIYSLSSTGGFYLRSDAEKVHEFIHRIDPLPELMKDDDFAESAFYYEMKNHEYHINWQGDWDVCNCFGDCEYKEQNTYRDYLKIIGYSENTVQAFYRARRKFLQDCSDNDWY